MKTKQLDIGFSRFDGYHISLSNNGTQWHTIYRDKDYGKVMIIRDAFKEVGYNDITDYQEMEVMIIKSNESALKKALIEGDKDE